MSFKKMNYYSFGSESSPGVVKKINNTVKATQNLGIQSSHKAFLSNDRLSPVKSLLLDDADLIFIRFSFVVNVLLFPIIIYKRLKGVKIVVDIPTPRSIGINELVGNKEKNYVFKIIWNYFFSSWILFPVNKVIQYADESAFFSFGLKHKTLKIGNGIWIDESVKLVEQNHKNNELNLIGVASLAFWHGYDRIIKAISFFMKKYPNCRIKLKIVGDGEVLDDLRDLVSDLALEDVVVFTGALYGADLDRAYRDIDLGVSSLGLYRKGLDEASDLKTREYMAKGLCVLGAGNDPDFSTECKYRITVPNDDSIEPILETLAGLMNIELPEPKEVREFAEKHLTFERKLEVILKGL